MSTPPPLTLRLASALFEIEATDPGRTSRRVLKVVCTLVTVLFVWACIANLDIVAVAQGRLVPRTYVKIVQPAEAGIIRETGSTSEVVRRYLAAHSASVGAGVLASRAAAFMIWPVWQ